MLPRYGSSQHTGEEPKRKRMKMSDKIFRGSAGKGVRLAAILCALAMILPAMAFIQADTLDAYDRTKVRTWDELKDLVEDGPEEVYIILMDDIIDKSNDDAIVIEDDRFVDIDLNGHKIDRKRGTEDGKDGRLFEISGASNVYISNGTLTGGHGDDGGCMYLDNVEVHLSNIILTGNYSDGDGGAIYLTNEALVSIYGGKICNNVCDGDGGAIYAEDGSLCAIRESEVYGNRAEDGCGGVLYADESSYEFKKSNVHDNYCEESGGVVYAEGVSDSKYLVMDNAIDNCTMSGNHTKKDEDCNGGAVCMIESNLIMYTTTFENNYCGFDGGAFYAEDSDVIVYSPIIFRNNNAPDSGGAMRLHGGHYDMGILTFEGNYANNCGGALYINNDCDVIMWDITMTGNSARLDGGGLLVGGDDDNTVEIYGQIIIKDNTAHRDGNNVFLREDQVLKCGELSQDSRIGVELQEGKGKITKNFSKNNPDVDAARLFFSDNSKYYVALDPDSGEAGMYKEGTSGDMSDNTNVWICVGIVVAIVALAAVALILRSKRSKNQ
jgi:predicted outer membrane repeat protein